MTTLGPETVDPHNPKPFNYKGFSPDFFATK
jgi:hypothetical protein